MAAFSHGVPRWINGSYQCKDLLTRWSQLLTMRIEKRSMNWLPRPSLYDEQAAKRAKQKAAHQAFLSSTSNLTTTVSGIMTNQVVEMGNIVANVVKARLSKTV